MILSFPSPPKQLPSLSLDLSLRKLYIEEESSFDKILFPEMAAKRFFDDDENQPNQKRSKTRPSFASVIREVVMANFLENFCSALEPMLRKVVSEEVENGLRQRCMGPMQRSPSLKMIQHAPPSAASSLRLAFVKRLHLPIFTGTKIVAADGDPLQIVLVDRDGVPTALPYPIKVEIVVVDGEFPESKDAWSCDEFAKSVVKERNGKRPLLAGDQLTIAMRDGVCFIGDVEFTDNSSWTRSRKFRLAARAVAPAQQGQALPPLIQEAVTEAFVVKDHRGELYKKHHPPSLEDEVWRLEKIGKDGAFHQKLSSHGINTVQDFLKLYNVDTPKLKTILGVGMSERMWGVTLKHAKTCVMGTKVYRFHSNGFTLIFSPICELIKFEFNGNVYYERHFKTMQMAYIGSLVKDAYAKWNSLEELDVIPPSSPAAEMVEQSMNIEQQQQPLAYLSDSNFSVMQNSGGGVVDGDYSDNQWGLLFNTTINNSSTSKNGVRFFSESSSE